MWYELYLIWHNWLILATGLIHPLLTLMASQARDFSGIHFLAAHMQHLHQAHASDARWQLSSSILVLPQMLTPIKKIIHKLSKSLLEINLGRIKTQHVPLSCMASWTQNLQLGWKVSNSHDSPGRVNGVALPAPKHALPCHLCQLSQKGKEKN